MIPDASIITSRRETVPFKTFGDEDLRYAALIIDGQIPRTVEECAIGECRHDIAASIHDLQGTLLDSVALAILRGHIADHDKSGPQHAECRAQARQLACEESRGFARLRHGAIWRQLDDGRTESL